MNGFMGLPMKESICDPGTGQTYHDSARAPAEDVGIYEPNPKITSTEVGGLVSRKFAHAGTTKEVESGVEWIRKWAI